MSIKSINSFHNAIEWRGLKCQKSVHQHCTHFKDIDAYRTDMAHARLYKAFVDFIQTSGKF